ncbi:D-aspartate oxidase-like [Hydractinia symbiolongicarpus]|uniref:D-aspartate oxidase-like n=1 Tax=Hydractinia symbiolongicarpus TaxID=13093 RepID=UPI00254F1B1F|nr:D-aspartate oxidase-like [Hydractinia symbiolongicarpus]
MKIAIIGAGIIGVSTAYRLKTTFPDLDVTVISKDFSPNTVSDVAAGFWEPFCFGKTPLDNVMKWSKETYDLVIETIRDDPDSAKCGFSRCHGYNLSENNSIEIPSWTKIVHDFKVMFEEDLKGFPEFANSGFSFTTVFIEPLKYIPWLSKGFEKLGGRFVRQTVTSLGEVCNTYDVIVNCTGFGSKTLLDDNLMYPIKGQVMRVKAPWVKEFVIYETHDRVSYVLPNQDWVILGGTKYENNPNTDVWIGDKAAIINGVLELCPSLKHATHLSDWAASRPCRSSMRVEKEDLLVPAKDGARTVKVVHNYGHGGSGVTVHWGCAGEAVQLITQCMDEIRQQKSKL